MNEKIERILKIAASNGLSLNRNFTANYLATHGFYDGPQTLAEDTVEKMEKLCFAGVNNGFDNSIKSALDRLSGVVISLTAVKNGDLKELSKLEVQRNKIWENVYKISETPVTDARKPVREYIETSVDAIDTMLSLKGEGQFFAFIEEKQFVFMEESKQKFAELSLLLVNTMDVGSVKAKEKAEKIIELISQWRRNCYNEILTSGSVQLLIEAIEIAKEWNTLSVTPAKKEKAKSVPSVEKDDLTSIAKGKVVLEKLDVFKGLIESKLKENDAKLAEINATKDKIAKLRSELDDLEKSKEDVARQLANDGDQAKANRAIVDIRLRKSRIETEIKLMSGNNMLVMREHTLNSNRETIMNIGSIVDMLNDNNGDLAFLAKAVDKVDFNALVEYMLGKTKNIDAARDSINRIKAEVTVLWKGIKRTSDEVKNDTNTVDEIISEHILGGLDIEEEQVNEEGLDPELAELMKKFKDEKTEEETEENKTKIKRAVPLGDDDK